MPDRAGMARLQLDGGSELGHLLRARRLRRDRPLRRPPHAARRSGYPAWLRAQGYDSADPWTDYVIAGIDADGQVTSGWNMRNVHLPARVAEAHSETAYTTDQAIGFMQRRATEPWVLHLSYVKPHWPYMAPAPYHAMYTRRSMPAGAAQRRRAGATRIRWWRRTASRRKCVSFQHDDCIRTVRPAYQGLITQLDDHLGRLFEHMAGSGRLDDTLVVFSADHGDYLGDHWLGEKELFHDTVQKRAFHRRRPAARRPTPRAARWNSVSSKASTSCRPSSTRWASTRPRTGSKAAACCRCCAASRSTAGASFAYSELDYSFRQARLTLGKTVQQCRAFSLRSERWRYVYWLDEPEQLFDLQADPNEFDDLGRDAGTAVLRAGLRDQLLDFLARRKHRSTVGDAAVAAATNNHKKAGVFYGQW